MNTFNEPTEHIRKHGAGRRPHRQPSAKHMDELSLKVKGKLNLNADQERDFDALVASFYELRSAHTDEWLNVETASPFEATEPAMAEAMEKVSEIHKQAAVFRWSLSEKQQAVFDKLMKRRGHRGGSRHRIRNKVS